MNAPSRSGCGGRTGFGQAIFEWIEAWYNPKRRHSGIGDVSPLDFEN